MALISFTQLVDGSTAVNAASVNSPLNTIYNEFNGNITDANIKTGAAIAGSKIAYASVSNPYKFYAYRSGAWSVSASSASKIPFETELFDTGSNFDSTTNFRFTAPVSGFYAFSARAEITATGNDIHYIALYKNGSEILQGTSSISATNILGHTVSGLLQLSANDYIEVYWGNGKAATQALTVGSTRTYMTGFLVSAT